MRGRPVLGSRWVDVPRGAGRAARRAWVEVRSLAAQLVPDLDKYPHGGEMTWNLVEVWGPSPPPGTPPLHRLRWTRGPAAAGADAWAVADAVERLRHALDLTLGRLNDRHGHRSAGDVEK